MTKGVEVDKQVSAELKELRKMKKAYERLQIEHDLLKKAIELASKRRGPKGNLSRHLHSQKPRQLAFAADLGR